MDVVGYALANSLRIDFVDKWSSRPSMPTARQAFAVGVINGKLYAVGGNEGSSYFANNEEYDPVTNTWLSRASMPTARSQLAVGVINGKLYAVGGYNGSVLATNEAYTLLHIEGLELLKSWLATRD